MTAKLLAKPFPVADAKYLVLDTGYTSRLVKKWQKLKKALRFDAYGEPIEVADRFVPMSVFDGLWGDGWNFFGPDDSDTAVVSRGIVTEIGLRSQECGLLLLKVPEGHFTMLGVRDIIEALTSESIRYCAFLSMENITAMATYKTSHGKVAYIEFDTESG
jgi:hypothetical protein